MLILKHITDRVSKDCEEKENLPIAPDKKELKIAGDQNPADVAVLSI